MRDAGEEARREIRPAAGCGGGVRTAGKCDAEGETAHAVPESRIALSRFPDSDPASRIGSKFRIPHPTPISALGRRQPLPSRNLRDSLHAPHRLDDLLEVDEVLDLDERRTRHVPVRRLELE